MQLEFRLNGRTVQLDVDGGRQLLWLLRDDLGLTGAKYGCGVGYCGSCTVLVDGRPMRACMVAAASVANRDVLTVEGLAADGRLHPLQQAFIEHGALQCGFCTPGILLAAYALLAANPQPTRQQVIDALDDNLCRCGAHRRILLAVEAVARNGGAPAGVETGGVEPGGDSSRGDSPRGDSPRGESPSAVAPGGAAPTGGAR
jgi:aerobic-type carbon monoxide dehydrogenase small subunit (CoxS/CutS family)